MSIILPMQVSVYLPAGNVDGWMHEIRNAIASDATGSTEKEATIHRDATHELTIRYREDIRNKQFLKIDGDKWIVLSVFDPYSGDDVVMYGTVVMNRKENSQSKKWTKVLVKRG